jgi:adenylate cyclase
MPSHLKKRVRERMAKTGESWVTALRHVRAQAATPPIPTPPASVATPPAPPPHVPAERRPARLIFTTASGLQAIELRSTNALGRDPRSSIQLFDKIVAKEHCVLVRQGGAFILRDLGSLNGTYVNGERVRGERALDHGDEIALGATRARYDDGVGPLGFAPPAICPGVAQPSEPGGWFPPDGGGGRGGAPAAVRPGAVPPPARPARERPN